MNYEDIRYSVPVGIKKKKPVRVLNWWKVLAFAAVLMVLFYAANVITYLLCGNEMIANLIGEVALLVGSVLFPLAARQKLKEIFPFHKPKKSALFGTFVLVPAMLLCAETISIITMYLFPKQLTDMADAMEESVLGGGFFLVLFNVCVIPAICEEAMHRGVIVHGLANSIRNRWIVVLCGGALFGVFHIYPIRWAAPALIGCVLTWVLLKTNNMLYGCLLHFLYNGTLLMLSELAERITGTEAASAAAININAAVVGIYLLFYALPVPVLLYTGGWLIRRSYEPVVPDFIESGKGKIRLLQIFLPTGIILVTGLFLIIAG